MLINVFSVKGYERWRNFRECPQGELRRIHLPRTSVNKGRRQDQSYYVWPCLLLILALGLAARTR